MVVGAKPSYQYYEYFSCIVADSSIVIFEVTCFLTREKIEHLTIAKVRFWLKSYIYNTMGLSIIFLTFV